MSQTVQELEAEVDRHQKLHKKWDKWVLRTLTVMILGLVVLAPFLVSETARSPWVNWGMLAVGGVGALMVACILIAAHHLDARCATQDQLRALQTQ